MDKKNRKTLKAYFKKGSLPSEQQFVSLIDSMLNTIDDGVAKNSEDGLKIASIGNSDKLIGFYKNIEMKSAIWSMEFDGSDNRLLFNHSDHTILSLDPQGRVGVNTKKPETELDVRGTLASTGRMGNYPGKHSEGKVLADGKPHTIIENLDGCTAFEIMAGVGGAKKSGKYALLHALALNIYNAKSKVVVHQAHYGSRCNRLKLWWEGEQHDYRLKIRTQCSYGEDIKINYQITELWFDPFMEGCRT
nr:hypothetical protein [uncultured Desulfobacter sp.]